MTYRRSFLRRLVVVPLAAALFAAAPAPPAHADDPSNDATAVNTQDGGTVFRFALSVRQVTNGLIDEKNIATANASCVDCRTVAIAFQVILVSGDADVVKPENRATAANVECTECLTYANATQLVIDVDGKELTANGKRRLKTLEKHLEEIEKNADSMTDAELLLAAQQAEAELIAIFDEELVPIGGTTTTTTAPTSTSTTSTTAPATTTSTTPPPTATTTPAAPTTTAAA